MKKHPHSTAPVSFHRRPTLSLVAAVAAVLAGSQAHAATITFGAATTIAGDTDVFTIGGLSYAYDLSNSAQTVNGVPFAAGASTTALGSDITMSGFDGGNNTTAFGSAGGGTWSGLSAAYRAILQGGNYTAGGTTATVNLNNLAAGHVYATQVWVNDNRDLGGGLNRSEDISSSGGNSITLDYNNTNGNGGVGQYTIGGFTADATTQAFTLLANNAGSQSSQFNAVQVRDVTGVWSGATNGAWDGGTANFTGGQFFATVSGLTTSVYFGDTDGFKNAVTNSNITVDAGGVSIGTVNFQNNAVSYTFDSADANGITGASNINKTGTGTVTFNGTNTYTGTTTVSAGTLMTAKAAALPGYSVAAAVVFNGGTVGAQIGGIGWTTGEVDTLLASATKTGGALGVSTANGNLTQWTPFTTANFGSTLGLNKLGANTLTLDQANTYNGLTTISAGTLQVGTGGATGSLGSGAVINHGNLVFFRNDTNPLNASAAISGSGAVAYNGPALAVPFEGQYLVDDTNSYTGPTTISNARVAVSNGAAFGTGAGAVVTVNSGGQIYTTAAITISNPIIINGNGWTEGAGSLGAIRMNGGTIAGDVTMASNSRISSYGASGSISGQISGNFNLEVTGQSAGNTITLGGANTYGGATSIATGTLSVSVAAGAARRFDASGLGLANGGNVTTWNDLSGNGANGTVPGGNATPTYIADGGTGTGLGAINFLGNTNATNSQALSFARDTNVRSIFSIFKGSSFLATDSSTYALHRLSDANPADALLQNYGQINYLGSVYVNGSLVGAPTTTAMPTASNNGYNLVEILTNGNSFALDSFNRDRIYHSGNQSQAEVIIFDTVVSEAQRVQIETYLNKKWFGTGPGIGNLLPTTTAVTISGGGTLDLSGENFQTVASISSTDASGTRIALGATALTFGDANDNTFDGVISGAGSLTKVGAGKQILTGANTFSGRTTISNGTLELGGAAGKLGTGPVTNNAALRLNPDAALTVAGAIDGTGELTQAGAGTTTLTGALTYTGATNITGGTLRIVGVTTTAVAGAARHFDASALALADGAAVTTWNDLSGNAADATVPGGNATPTYIANAGTGTGLGAINLPKNGGAATSGAFSFARDTDVRSVFSIFKGNSFLATDSSTYALHRPGDDNAADALLANYGQINYLGSVYVNGSLVGAPLSTAMPTSSNNGYNLVEIVTNGNSFALDSFNKDRGNIHAGNQSQAEVLIYDSVLTESQRLHNESYLSNKWFGTGAAALLPSNTPVTISNGGTLDLIGAQTIGSLSSTDGLGSQVIVDTSLTVGNATDTTFDGVISGVGSLVKTGASRLTLTGASTYTGPTTISNGTLELAGTAGALGAGAITNNGTLLFNRTNDLTIGNAIGGSGAVTQSGAGTTTLTGASGYSGATSVNSGSLLLNAGSLGASSAVSVASVATFGGIGSAGAVSVSGGTIQGGIADVGSLSLSSLSFSGSSALNLMPVTGLTASVAVSGVVTTSGTQTLNITSSAPLLGGAYRLVSYGSLAGTGIGAFALGATPATGAFRPRGYALDTTTSPSTYVGLTVTLDAPIWTGVTDGNWDTTTTGNWKLASDNLTATTYYTGDAVQFNNPAGTRNVVISGVDVTPLSVAFNNGTGNDYTLSGSNGIAGSASLSKAGLGKLTITNTNSYTGGTNVSAGTLELGDGATNGVIAGAIANTANVTFNNATAQTFSGNITGTGGTLTKIGAGTLTLAGTNSHTGGTTVSAGILVAGNNSALGALGSSVTVAGGATLDLGNAELFNYTQPITISGSGVGGVGAIYKSTPGNGALLQLRGIVLASDASIGGVATSRIDIGRGDWTGPGPGAPIHIDGQGHTLSVVGGTYLGILAEAVNLAGITIGTGASVAPHNDASFASATLTIDGGTLTPWNSHTFSNNLVVTGNGGFIDNQAYTQTYTGTVQVNGATQINTIAGGNITMGGNITGAGAITKTGGFSLFLSGDNSGYTGAFTNSQSNTFFGSATAGSSSAAFVVNAGNLANTTAGTVTQNLGSLAGSGGTVGNNVGASAVTFSIGANGADTAYSGSIVDTVGGGGTTAITKVGTGELTLSGTLSYTGVTNVDDGTLNVNSALGAGANIVNANGGETNFNVSQTLAALNIGAGAVVTLGAAAPAPFAGEEVLAAGTAAVPEPGALGLLMAGGLGLLGRRRRQP